VGYKKNIHSKKVIMLIYIAFSLFIAGSFYFVFKSGKNMDIQHISVMSLSTDVDNKTLKTRIYIDELLLKKDSTFITHIKTNLDTILLKLEKLKFIFTEEFEKVNNKDLDDFTKEYKIISTKLSSIKNYIETNEISGERLLKLYSEFYASYQQFGQYLHKYLFDNTIVYEKEIWSLLVVLFLFIVLAGYLIIHLINKLIITDRNLIRKTIEIESRERQRIAADLHDELGAYLSSLIMYIEVLEQECDENPDLADKIAQVNKLSRHAIKSVEVIVSNLNPSYLSRLGLAKTIEKAISKINSLNKTQFLMDTANFKLDLAPSVEITLYRICTELINNALKHSSAKNARITLFNQRKKINLIYEDNGVGFHHAKSSHENSKMGLQNLAMRVASLGGSYKVDSEPGRGVKIEISLNVI
jgi:signal transduction histidine kinase